jgi:glycosyltransferase involved in cell wall biosynthesis
LISVPSPQRKFSRRLNDLLLTQRADIQSRFASSEYASQLTRLLEADTVYDVIQFEGLEMATYLPLIKKLRPNAKMIYGAANAEYELQRLIFSDDRRQWTRLPATAYSLMQWRRLKAYERWVCRQVTHVIATSAYDADALKALAPETPVSVVPNGIYVQDYLHTVEQLDLGPQALLFTGSMGYRPNVDAMLWFADSVMPAIREEAPEATLYIVGKNPHSRLDGLRQRADIRVTGFVQDVTPFLHGCAVYVAPLRSGSGTRLKLLQAMAAGCAIVATAVGAQGIEIQPGKEMIIADTAAAFSQAVAMLLRDAALRATMGKAAQDFVCASYDWPIIVPRLLAAYREIGIG